MTATDKADTAPERVKPHWWWRPGFRMGRRFYTCYVTLEGHEDLHRMVDDHQRALAAVPYLDLIPRPWRHMTVQGIGFTDEVSDHDITQAPQHHLARLPSGVDLIEMHRDNRMYQWEVHTRLRLGTESKAL